MIEFDEYAAAEQVREIAAVLQAVADSMKAHSLTPSFPRPGRAQVKAAVAAFDKDASVAATEPADDTSPAWQAL